MLQGLCNHVNKIVFAGIIPTFCHSSYLEAKLLFQQYSDNGVYIDTAHDAQAPANTRH